MQCSIWNSQQLCMAEKENKCFCNIFKSEIFKNIYVQLAAFFFLIS